MRKLVLALSVMLLLITPVLAREPEEAAMPDFGAQALEQALDGQTREALGDVSAASVGDFATQLWNIVTDALSNANLALRSALFSAGKVLAAGILCAFASGAQEDPGAKQPAQIAGAFAITALCTRDAQSMIALARETITKISDFTALLLPVLSSSLAASGGSVSAGTLLAGGSFAMSLLTKLASGVLIPLVYLYILLAAAESATDGGGLGKIRELCGWAVRLSVKGLCAVFTAYLSLSRVLTGSADAMAVKAAQDAQSPAQQTQPADDMRQALSRLLSSMEGVGRVELLLTTTGSDETFYQTDVRRSGETSEETTVFSANQSAQKTPVVTKTKKASYAGAVVVCDGADSAVVRLRIVQAVSALTGLGSDKISVIKMKQS